MALKSPLMPSPNGALASAFSPYTDSPNSPAPFGKDFHAQPKSNRNSDSLAPPASPYPQTVEPSPVDSNGTESTEIDEDAQDDSVKSPNTSELQSPSVEITSPQSAGSEKPNRLDVSLALRPRSDSAEDDPQSVIHAPEGFKQFDASGSAVTSPTNNSEETMVLPSTPEAKEEPQTEQPVVSPVNTSVPRINDRSTPQAQTRQDFDDDAKRKSKRKSVLHDIPESSDKDDVDEEIADTDPGSILPQELDVGSHEIARLQGVLLEIWRLCNSFGGLSAGHRQRTFSFTGQHGEQEQAWQTCWRLCQRLYESRTQEEASPTIATLEMCRDFCQALFDVRKKMDEASDSVLRVSFELNNHLYNTHDRALPEQFNERTLDFYVTMCHRLMKQPTTLPPETDELLRACWALTEVLFNLRQSQREGKALDEDMLSSAIDACWHLCNLFRQGWSHAQSERGTPRPSQTTFGSQTSLKSGSGGRSDGRSNSSLSNRIYHDARAPPPETPTTIFDDSASAASSPDSVTVPNILVLGPAKASSSSGGGSLRGTHHDRWTSGASVLSGYSESASSQRTSSTATAGKGESHLLRLRYLLLKAGMNTGYSRTSGQQLPAYINTLSKQAFGNLPWQMKVFSYYRKLVTNDKSMRNVHTSLAPRRIGASEMAKSITWLGDSEQWAWMRDLYRIVFGFGIDEAERRGGGFHVS